jgi:hypothetical protein
MWMIVVAPVMVVALAGCGAAESGQGGGDTGIRGVTVASPGCPVESAASPCPGTGVVGHVRVRKVGGSEIVAEVVSSADGGFSVDVPAGRYLLTATASRGLMQPQATRAIVRVYPGRVATVTLRFDSGIRAPGPGPG